MNTHSRRWMVTGLASSGLALVGVSGYVARGATLATTAQEQARHTTHTTLPVVAQGEASLAFREAMRRLWQEHIVWTRLYIVSAAADLPDRELTAARLLRNQSDIGDAITPFYGEAAGKELTALLTDHITGAVALLDAAKRGDQDAVEVASANWYANGGAIARFLHSANSERWPLADLQAEMTAHLDLTLEEATARLHGDFAADIAAYDQIEDHILHLADLLSDGVIAQFTDRFA